jgi:23S rRNA pseudouridine1911/1915/1917 synthase
MSLNGPRTIPVPTSSVSNRLDIFLSTELRSSHTRSFVAQICDSGQVEVNGKVQNKGYKLKANDVVTLNEGNLETPDGDVAIIPEKIDLEILYEDDHILAINKPVGMVVHPAVGSPNGTFVNALLHYLGPSASKHLQNPAPTDAELKSDPQERDERDMDVGANVRPSVVHRLDKGTSGVLLAGKSFQWVSRMSRLFARREVSKVYFAICVGNPGCTTIAKPIGRCAKNRQQMCTYDGPPGKLAVTHVRTLAFDGKLSACLLKIDTGRLVCAR